MFMLLEESSPELAPDLVAALADLDGNGFSHLSSLPVPISLFLFENFPHLHIGSRSAGVIG
jgi:hypothetical protein